MARNCTVDPFPYVSPTVRQYGAQTVTMTHDERSPFFLPP
jgi:hypothetical protein